MKWFILPLFVVFLASCEKVQYETPVIPNDTVYFSTAVQPILDNNCVSCHPPAKGLDLNAATSYGELVPAYVSAADSANPEGSKLYVKLIGTSHTARTSDLEKLKISKWISEGARNN
jgi:hypothetical protein